MYIELCTYYHYLKKYSIFANVTTYLINRNMLFLHFQNTV